MPKPASHNTADLRRMNRNRVFRYLLFDAPQGARKQDLALALNMSLPTLTQNLSELSELGLIDRDKLGDSSGGRPPRILSVAAQARWAVGVEAAPRHIQLVALDLLAQVLDFQVLDRPFLTPEGRVEDLLRALEPFIDRVGLGRERLLGVGLSFPAILAENGMRIVRAPTLDLRDVDLRPYAGRIPYPIHVVNDANAGGYAECWGRAEAGPMAYLSLGRGVGGAIVFSDRAYLGQNGRSGEFGHMCVHPGGAACSCGRRGCLEAYCSVARLSDDLGIPLETFFSRLDGGDPQCAQLWSAYLDDLAVGVGNIRMALDCPIVLGGKLSLFLGPRMEELKRRLREQDPDHAEPSYLSICRHHDRANSMGAALHFIEDFIRQV